MQMINGQQVEVMTAKDSDDDMENVEEGILMQGEDGQHYLVLEVIQLANGQTLDGSQQSMMQRGKKRKMRQNTKCDKKCVNFEAKGSENSKNAP